MQGTRSLLIGLISLVALAQQPPQVPPAPPVSGQGEAPVAQDEGQATFRTSVDVVVAPVTVKDREGSYVNGLQPADFHLFDNGKEQNIRVDVAFQPISMVIAIQANGRVDSVLPQIQKIGGMIQPILLGEAGEAAVLAFDHRMQVLQDFTSDSTKVSEAIRKIHAGSSVGAIVDAANKSVLMLRNRPANRRRILLLISETRDYGSQARPRETLLGLQIQNISVYTVNISRVITSLMAKPQPARPSQLPPAARPLPSSVPGTPTAVDQMYGSGSVGRAEFIPLMVELFKDVKSIFVDNPAELFTKGTGGTEYSFMRQRGLEDAVAQISNELHSQYLISYTPNNKEEGGFHEITVQVASKPGAHPYKVHTRPGYWIASRFK